MIIVRTPLRLSIVGGGTDLRDWSKDHESIFISAGINRFVFTTLHRSLYDSRIRLRYSKMEEVNALDEIKHEIFRETLRRMGIESRIELTSHAEIPSGTGLGSSGSFGVSILHALNPKATKEWLEREASHIQIDILKYPIGIQDQIASSYGGVNIYRINLNGEKNVTPFDHGGLENKLVLFYTGIKRDTNEVLKTSSTDGLEKIQELAHEFIKGKNYGEILKEHWEYKKKRGGMTNPFIDEMHELALKNGAISGKIVGSGGGGHLLFYTEDRERLIKAMPLLHVPFNFEYNGSTVIFNDEKD